LSWGNGLRENMRLMRKEQEGKEEEEEEEEGNVFEHGSISKRIDATTLWGVYNLIAHYI